MIEPGGLSESVVPVAVPPAPSVRGTQTCDVADVNDAWNLVRRCNLTCQHCYSISCDRDFPGELDTADMCAVMDDLAQFRVPVLILFGGEPLLRPDIFEIDLRSKDLGFYVGLSTNGTLIDDSLARRIAATGFD